MAPDLIIPLILIGLCLLGEAFFSGSEMGIVSSDRTKLRQRAQKGDLKAKSLLKVLENPERILITTLLGTNLMVVTIAALSTFLIMRYFPKHSELISMLILTPIVLILGEIVPKGVCQQNSTKIAPRILAPLFWVGRFFFPLRWVVEKYIHGLSRLFKIPRKSRLVATKEELRLLLETTGPKSDLKAIEKIMISKIFEFSRINIKEMMIPLIDVDAIEERAPVSKAVELIDRTRHTRIPIYRDRIDNMVGILYSFDLLGIEDVSQPVSAFVRSSLYVPETQRVEKILREMKQHGHRMAIVVDEYGGAEGIVTMEDILEEVVGTIEDEFDFVPKLYQTLEDGSLLIHARIDLTSLGELLGWEPLKGDYVTLGGFLLSQFGHIPKEGEYVEIEGFRFSVRRASRRAIELVNITRIPSTEESAPENTED